MPSDPCCVGALFVAGDASYSSYSSLLDASADQVRSLYRWRAGAAEPTGQFPNDEPLALVVEQRLPAAARLARADWVTPACQLEQRVAALVHQLTLTERIGQKTDPDQGQVRQHGLQQC